MAGRTPFTMRAWASAENIGLRYGPSHDAIESATRRHPCRVWRCLPGQWGGARRRRRPPVGRAPQVAASVRALLKRTGGCPTIPSGAVAAYVASGAGRRRQRSAKSANRPALSAALARRCMAAHASHPQRRIDTLTARPRPLPTGLGVCGPMSFRGHLAVLRRHAWRASF
jgi:hypothetical protein